MASAAVEKTTLQRIRVYLVLLAVLLSSLVFSAIWWDWGDTLNKLVYDQLLQLRPTDPPADVIIIAVDEYSLSHVGEWPWSRRYHARLIDTLTSAGVKAIGFDVVFAEPNPMDPEGDAAFVEAIRNNGKVVLPVYIDRTQLGGQLIEVLPHPMFAEYARMGHVNTELDADGIVRRFYHYEGIGDAFWSHFATVVAQISNDYQQPEPGSLASGAVSPLVNVRRLPRLIPFLGGVGSFQQVSFYDVISGKVPARLFRDRVVFVGATSISLGDLLPTPVTVQGEQMPGVEINATIFTAARNHSFIVPVERHWRLALGVFYVLATVLLIPRVAGRASLLFIVFSSVLVLAAQAMLMLRLNLWLPFASALLGQWLVYPLWTVLRLDQTLRYLKKQLILLREELGQQSLAERHDDSVQDMAKRISLLMDMASVKDYSLYVDLRLYTEANHKKPAADFLQPSRLPAGPYRNQDWFCCRYDHHGRDYVLQIPLGVQENWTELREAYVVGFFENEFSGTVEDYFRTYDLVFKYLNEVRISQLEVNNARLLFEYCVNEMNDGVIIADEFGEVLFVNRAALSYLSLKGKDGLSLMDLLMKLNTQAADCNWQQVILDLIANRTSPEVEASTESGHILLANLSYLDVSAHRSNLIVINLYDITRIREAQRLRNETIDFLSHDMRSPMVSLLALVNQKRSEHSDDEFLAQIEHYANKNLYFAEQFLQLARVESNETLQFYDLDFEATVQNAIDDVYSQAREKNITLVFAADDGLYWVNGNGELLERSIVNLLTNAIKYGPADSSINIQLKRYGAQELMLSVTDQGPGIPKSQQPQLFAPYQRLEGATKSKQKGAGLGLRFVDVTIRRHGGSIFFNSQPGRTEFGFTLPVTEEGL